MVDFVTEVSTTTTDNPSTFPTFQPTTNPSVFFPPMNSDSNYMHPIGPQLTENHPTEPSQNFMSLGQLSNEYATYLLLNQSLDNNAIMAAISFQKTFPLPIGTQSNPNSLSSLLPYASLLGLMGGFDSSNLLGNLQILQAAASAMASIDQQNLAIHQQNQGFETSSAATCASSIVESPLENNNNTPIDPNLLLKQQFSQITPTSSPPSALDDSLQNSISKNKLGRQYNPGRPLSMVDRQRILDLYKKGYKISHIARIIGVTHSCVSKIMTRYRRTGSMHPRSAAQVPRKNSSNSSPTHSSTSPLSNVEVSSIFTTSSSMELSDSASSTCSFLVPQTSAGSLTDTSSLIFNTTQMPSNTPTSNEQLASLLIHKPIPVKNSVY